MEHSYLLDINFFNTLSEKLTAPITNIFIEDSNHEIVFSKFLQD